MIYLDTSYLAKVYVDEPGSAEVLAWIEGKANLVCAMHGRIELVAAFKRKQREAAVTGLQLSGLLRAVSRDVDAGLIRWLPLEPNVFDAACTKIAQLPPGIFLRAADALHLASAADAGLKQIYSHDRHLLAAAPHFGLKGMDVINAS